MHFDYSVSVVTPVFNSENYIRNVVDCVNSQTLKVSEHIIIDDGSTDGTLLILRELEQKYEHIVVLSQTNNGAASARNLGVKLARGKYIAFLDSDDVWLPTKLESQIGFMELNGVSFSYGDYQEIDGATDQILYDYRLQDEISYGELLNGCPIGCLTVAYNQRLLGKQFMPDVRRGQDWALWLNITKTGVVAKKYPGCLAQYRISKTSLSKNKLKKLFDVIEIYRDQQGLSVLRSIFHLFKHIKYVRGKRR